MMHIIMYHQLALIWLLGGNGQLLSAKQLQHELLTTHKYDLVVLQVLHKSSKEHSNNLRHETIDLQLTACVL